MALGERIRFLRKLRGQTQKELGEAVGFSSNTADVRIGQYETNVKKPRTETLSAIAKALDVNVDALIVPDLSNRNRIIHTLFLMEDELGFTIGKDPIHYYIELNATHPMFETMESIFREWYDVYVEYRRDYIDKATYNNWRYNYPFEYTPSEEASYQQFLRITKEINTWNLKCKVIQMPPEGLFETGKHYAGKVITASEPFEFRDQLFDEGFLIKDGFGELYPFSMSDFTTHFKIQ